MLLRLHQAAVPGRLLPMNGELAAGQLLHVAGPNGAGKSTLLSVIAGLQPASGRVLLDEKPLIDWRGAALSRVRGWLPQQQAPLSQMPVWHYLRLHLKQAGSQSDVRLSTLLQQLQLQDKLTRSLTRLSGGEWQRVRLAAVCAQIDPLINPHGRLLILDEPMTALDIGQQKAADDLIAALCAAGISVIASSHDLNHSLQHADRVWLMNRGQVVAQGEPAKVLTPQRLTPLYQITFRQIQLEGRTLLTVLP
ncbi:vitamin B12 ABC transporter ATP-binding protein BtuD [Pantoea eucalypti]|uniref:Vitamin B12 import ATP-binding protein BtuD n=1 Tax=Pantoea eucalypti TaxID=470933 RepID=A0ABY2ZN04_9GAMM|nr:MULTISPECIES: vitamin B12 ABC transporter ATP-binding protein BtuD [Pantoea]QXG53133.1 vitamin B12 ABC transporter ATP-binding protein BtuD [Pantoea jilinensis]EFM19167.1 ABC transporter related protein [Pantoea sp. aB]ELP24092.1 Vitamin B12 ABC transporter, ATPase component BtuD [Pantoea agglomerans 299R]QGF27270.1 vitamin B12 ABC transporter ATP-binding protein BtuD [Pantoea eucalypti]QNQ57270.1 vitamin B12 ABC transporter ATP-binding protein BtuD [Pantoea sp. MT58]